jgi:hypothetical protein
VSQQLTRLRNDGQLSSTAARAGARPWTAAQVAELTRRLEAGERIADIAAGLGRSESAVRTRAYRLAASDEALYTHPEHTRPAAPVHWSASADRALRAAYAAGYTYAVIGREVDRTAGQVAQRIDALQRHETNALIPRKPRWTAARREHLARRRNEGATLRQLEREFGIARGTLTYQLRQARSQGLL